MIAFV